MAVAPTYGEAFFCDCRGRVQGICRDRVDINIDGGFSIDIDEKFTCLIDNQSALFNDLSKGQIILLTFFFVFSLLYS